MKYRILSFLFILIILVGVGVLSYPFVMSMISSANQSAVVSDYNNKVDESTLEERNQMLAVAERYNKSLFGNVILTDPFDEENQVNKSENFNYEEILSMDVNGTMGYITIPAIDVNLPIYHGTEDARLQLGVGHLVNSSLPVGGATTHSILAGHTGLPDAVLFNNLVDVVEGDYFYIHILGEVHEYKVDQIKVVEPSNVSDFVIVPDKDYITLVTCTPYGVNSHRLLVRGERTDYDISQEVYEETITSRNDGFYFSGIYIDYTVFYCVLAGICLGVVTFIVILIIRKKRKKKKKHLKEE
jgi:sortase A